MPLGYCGTSSTRIRLPATPNSLLTLQRESSVLKSIYKCLAWFFIRKRKWSILLCKAEGGLNSCSTQAKPGEGTKGPMALSLDLQPHSQHDFQMQEQRPPTVWTNLSHISLLQPETNPAQRESYFAARDHERCLCLEFL